MLSSDISVEDSYGYRGGISEIVVSRIPEVCGELAAKVQTTIRSLLTEIEAIY